MRLGDKHRRLVKNGYSAYLKLSVGENVGLIFRPASASKSLVIPFLTLPISPDILALADL
jgi:hypothetical protein